MQPISTRENVPPDDTRKSDTLIERLMVGSFRDTDVVGRGEGMARTLRGQFFNLYSLWAIRQGGYLEFGEGRFFEVEVAKATCPEIDGHPRLRQRARAALFVSGPEHAGANPIEAEYIRRLNGTHQKAYMGSLYCRLTPGIKQALIDAKERQVEVEAVLPDTSGYRASHIFMGALSMENYRHYSHVWEYGVANCRYHSKKAVFDDSAAIVGSFNLSWKSAYCDAEFALSIDSDEVVGDLMEGFQEDIARSKEVKRTPPSLGMSAMNKVVSRTSMLDGIITG